VVSDQAASRQTRENSATPELRGGERPAWAVAATRVCFAVVLTGAAAFVLMIVAAPWLATHGHPIAAFAIYSGFKPACHQLPERSFHLFGAPLAVCARCTGIYAGVLFGLAALPLLRGLGRPTPSRLWFALAAIPVSLDFALGWLGLVQNTALSRSLTGALFGAVTAFYLMPGFVEVGVELAARKWRNSWIQTS
jgi:uncharacterized membrane protein